MDSNFSRQLNQLTSLVIILAVLCLGSIGYTAWISSKSFGSSVSSAMKHSQESQTLTAADHAAKIVEELGYTINGTVVSASPTSITVKANIVDDTKLASLDYSRSNRLETIEKTFVIGITKETIMPIKPKVNDMVSIKTNESIYQSSTLTASMIQVMQSQPQP